MNRYYLTDECDLSQMMVTIKIHDGNRYTVDYFDVLGHSHYDDKDTYRYALRGEKPISIGAVEARRHIHSILDYKLALKWNDISSAGGQYYASPSGCEPALMMIGEDEEDSDYRYLLHLITRNNIAFRRVKSIPKWISEISTVKPKRPRIVYMDIVRLRHMDADKVWNDITGNHFVDPIDRWYPGLLRKDYHKDDATARTMEARMCCGEVIA